MNRETLEIPAEAAALVRDGRMVEAVKITRERTGLSLKAAKDAVDAYLRDPQLVSLIDSSQASTDRPAVPRGAVAALERGRLLEAIKLTREANRIGLKDAKETVERFLVAYPATKSRFKAATSAELKQVVQKVMFFLSVLCFAVVTYLYFTGND